MKCFICEDEWSENDVDVFHIEGQELNICEFCQADYKCDACGGFAILGIGNCCTYCKQD